VATRSAEEILRAAASAGFGAVGLDAVTVEATDADPGTALRQHGLACTEVGVLAVGQTNGLATAAALGRLARSTGARLCVTVADTEPGPELVRQLRGCADVLGVAGVRLALEFLPYGPVSNLPDTVELCAAVGWDRCGLLLDSWHFFHSGQPWEALRALSGEQIALIQINDAPPPIGTDLRWESRFRRVPPGAGTFALDAFVAACRDIGFDGVVSPEVLSADLNGRPVEDTARTLMSSLHSCWPDASRSKG
jgi:sugar phosphate isomerase/epimerase